MAALCSCAKARQGCRGPFHFFSFRCFSFSGLKKEVIIEIRSLVVRSKGIGSQGAAEECLSYDRNRQTGSCPRGTSIF